MEVKMNNGLTTPVLSWGLTNIDGTYVSTNEPIDATISISNELEEKINKLESLFFRKVVSKCPACGQWGAALCECKHCGHPIG